MRMTVSPYSGRPASAFWKTAVSEGAPNETGIYRKRFEMPPGTRIATAGSCFAQHIAYQLRRHGHSVVDFEPPPPGMSDASAKRFGYRLFSARYGNIYTVRQLLQLFREALGTFQPADIVWEKGARYFDALRPGVEPEGLESPALIGVHRRAHLKQIRRLLELTDVFIFTFGLTEAWTRRECGTVYPTAPGTIAGSYSEDVHAFRNFTFTEILEDFVAVRDLWRSINPSIRFLLTVSPVPLAATATDVHVLQATTYSKSVLRAVAGQLYSEFDDTDYFPSYELIGTPFMRTKYYLSNLREVSREGVGMVMRTFFAEHGSAVPGRRQRPAPTPVETAADDAVCEDALLEAFAR
jgi:hypothetical protein